MTEIQAITRLAPGLPTLIKKYAAHDEIFIAGEDDEMYVELEVEAGNASSFCNQAARLSKECVTRMLESTIRTSQSHIGKLSRFISAIFNHPRNP